MPAPEVAPPEVSVQRRLREQLALAHALQQGSLLARLRAAALVERTSRLDADLAVQHWLRSRGR